MENDLYKLIVTIAELIIIIVIIFFITKDNDKQCISLIL